MRHQALDRVARRNPHLNAVVLVQEEKAREAIAKGLPDGPLRGVPFLLKDLGCEAVDFPGHNGSRLLANTRWPRNSAIFDRIRATCAADSPESIRIAEAGSDGVPAAA